MAFDLEARPGRIGGKTWGNHWTLVFEDLPVEGHQQVGIHAKHSCSKEESLLLLEEGDNSMVLSIALAIF